MPAPVEFHDLEVLEVEPLTDEAVAVTFAVPPRLRPVSDTCPVNT